MDKKINQYIEHTNLNPSLTGADIDQLIDEAKKFEFVGVCVPPFWVKRAKREIGNAPISLVTVIGFPLGYQMTETKIQEIKQAIEDGADEFDLVINLSALKSGMPWVKIEFAKCAKLLHEHHKILKVIIETAMLTNEEIVQASKLAVDAGADYVKTSTGFNGHGATVEHVSLIRSSVPDGVGVKASGGIKTLEDARQMIAAGADRIGASAGVAIVNESMKA